MELPFVSLFLTKMESAFLYILGLVLWHLIGQKIKQSKLLILLSWF